MALDSRRRARKLEKKAAKDKARRERKRRQGLPARVPGMAQLSIAPIHEALMPEGLFNIGIGNVVLSRKLGNTIWVGIFLVDSFCLGVKNALLIARNETEYGRMVAGLQEKEHLIPIQPACVRKLVENAVTYAQDLGFGPHKSYLQAKMVFGDIDADACPTSFEFGENGKPSFIAGPHDSEARCQQILAQLTKRCGPRGFHYMVAIGTEGFKDFDEDQFDAEELEER